MNRPPPIPHPAEALVLAKISASVRERLARIKLMVFDVDGILTDGSLWYGERGEVFKRFNALDGHGLKMLAASGVNVVLMTGRSGPIVDRRAAQKDDLRNRPGLAKLRRPLDTPVTKPRLTWS